MYVRSLTTAEEILRYVEFGQEVYRQTPHWVPPDILHQAELLRGQVGFGPNSPIQAFWVEEGDRVLATVAAATHETYNRHWNEQMGHLVFFEALPDQDDAVESLMRTACDWLRARGCETVRLSLLPGLQLPLTIDAYDAVPTIFHTYNPPYYHSYIKDSGFRTEHGAVQYQIRFTPDLAQRYSGMVERAAQSGVVLRSWDFERLDQETETFTDVFNETFRSHWGFMPLSTNDMRGLTVELKDFLVPDFTTFAEVDGQTVGFVYSLPDLNQAFHRMRGRAIEEHFSEFQQHLQKIDHGVLLVIGVKQEYRGRGINLALAARSYLAMIDHGYKTGSYTVVLDDNWRSRRTAEKLGARVTRNFNIYRKELS
ncbi:MAG TPA: GNAT family N-acetyltransferase [Blastocatellia bacterium]|nr:GNAT family N-acetyltransferase [Blastocatellia bacterium]